MKKTIIASLGFLLAISGASAQTTSAPSNSTAPAAVPTTKADSNTTAAPLAGHNSFTEAQAKSRIEKHGFTDVSALRQDDKHVWRGTATKDGKTQNVSVDYQGNVVGN